MRTRSLDLKENIKQKYDNPYCETCSLKEIKKKKLRSMSTNEHNFIQK